MLIENQLKKLGFGTAAAFILVVAVLLGSPMMYLMAVIIALVPVSGWVLNQFLLTGIHCERIVAGSADEHGRIDVTVIAENRGWLPKFYVRVTDVLPRYLRYAGSPTGESVFITSLWPGESTRVRYAIEPMKRGLHRVGPLAVQATDVFGFSNRRKVIPSYSELLVFPETLPVGPALLSSGAAAGWRDDENSRSRGNGSEFIGVREYRPGDELRRVNWKTTARTGALAVTEYAQGYASDVTIVLDCQAAPYAGAGEGRVSAFEYAVTIAASTGAAALRQGSAVQLCLSGAGHGALLQLHGADGLSTLLDRLARVEPTSDVALEEQLSDCAGDVKPGGVVVLLTARTQADATLRGHLEAWTLPPISATLNVFWMDRAAFANARRDVMAARFLGRASDGYEEAVRRRTDLGTECTVTPAASLARLLSRDGLG